MGHRMVDVHFSLSDLNGSSSSIKMCNEKKGYNNKKSNGDQYSLNL